METQDGLIDQLVTVKMYDLPADYLNTYRDRVSAVTAEEIQRVAQQHVTPDRAAVVIVGDAAEVEPQIKEYAETIEVYDTEGKKKE
jgi:zinc protease